MRIVLFFLESLYRFFPRYQERNIQQLPAKSLVQCPYQLNLVRISEPLETLINKYHLKILCLQKAKREEEKNPVTQ